MKFSESIALLRGWVEIIVTKTLEFLEMKIYSPLSVEKIEENLLKAVGRPLMFFNLVNL